MSRKFTIKEIRKYLDGCRMNDGNGIPCRDYNFALDHAIAFIDAKEDGIYENLMREQWYIQKKPLDRYVGCPCSRISEKDGQQCGATYLIEKVDNKNRKLLVFGAGKRLWISTKTFFDKWMWGPRCDPSQKS